MDIVADRTALKLLVANGEVWQAAGPHPAEATRCTPDEFLKRGSFTDTTLRLVGIVDNAELIVRAFEMGLRVEVCTPLICHTRAQRQRPTMVLTLMRLCMLAPSQGGFHRVSEDDLPAYGLLAAKSEAERQTWLEQHMGYRALRFFGDLNRTCVADVLSHIVDPRWFVDPVNPDRLSKLTTSLGLRPHIQMSVMSSDTRATVHHAMCDAVWRSWWTAEEEALVVETFRRYTALPVAAKANLPGLRPSDVLWRVWGARRGYTLDEKITKLVPAKAYLCASQYLIRWLRDMWLALLYRRSPMFSELFDIDSLFKTAFEREAFRMFCQKEFVPNAPGTNGADGG